MLLQWRFQKIYVGTNHTYKRRFSSSSINSLASAAHQEAEKEDPTPVSRGTTCDRLAMPNPGSKHIVALLVVASAAFQPKLGDKVAESSLLFFILLNKSHV